jgi:predicted nucleic-acid-binding Zn-ribbon protein
MKVPLFVAWRWECPNCKANNFVKGQAVKLSKEETEAAQRALLAIQPYEPVPEGVDGEFVTAPTRVLCPKCRSTFETEDDGEA